LLIEFEIHHFARVLNLLNNINLVVYFFHLLFMLSMEWFKLSFAPAFYYGNLGTSQNGFEDNSGYPDGVQPLSLIRFFAALSII